MKIVINAYSAKQGGGQTYLINLLSHLPAENTPLIEVFAPSRLHLAEHPNIRRVSTTWSTENPLMRALWEWWWLPRYLKSTGADVLFCPGGLVVTKVPKFCRVVTMFRNMTPFDDRALRRIPWGLQRLRNYVLRRLMLRSMREADLTIFISEFARGVIETLSSIPNPVTIPHGIAEAFRSEGKTLPLPSIARDGPYLLYVSKIDSYKHHEEVVHGYAQLPADLRARCRLVLAGEANSVAATHLRQTIAKLGLEDRVVIYGVVNYLELPTLYQHAEANLFASSCENCPNILLEALAAGRPVLSSNVDPMPEFGGQKIGYFSPFDPVSIAQAMRQVLEEPDTAIRWAAAAIERSGEYDWNLTAQKTWSAIHRLNQK
jgi:glycosyltransferase involved in cell wall biosynthesis